MADWTVIDEAADSWEVQSESYELYVVADYWVEDYANPWGDNEEAYNLWTVI